MEGRIEDADITQRTHTDLRTGNRLQVLPAKCYDGVNVKHKGKVDRIRYIGLVVGEHTVYGLI